MPQRPAVAVLIPCRNEARTVATVIGAFKRTLPDAAVFVYDNASDDDTASVASGAGASVRREQRRGKGSVVRRMLADIEADTYVLVDGDNTYAAEDAVAMIERLETERVDLVNGHRHAKIDAAYRNGHRFGNRLFSALVASLFGRSMADVLSGYKVFTRRFAKSFPVASNGFEIEVELAIHALTLGVPLAEVPVTYGARPSGSSSKLHAIPDGLRILRTIARLYRHERPLSVYGAIGLVLAVISISLAVPLASEFLRTGLVPRFPTAVLCTGLMLAGMLSLACGIVLEAIKRGQRELKRMLYLQLSGR